MITTPTRKTRLKILRAAERLFAERGIDQTSIRLINQAAEQRNSSATQYHFGNKAGLIAAIFDHRMQAINEHRLELLRELTRGGPADDLRAMVEILVIPLAEHLDKNHAGFYYLPVAAQVIGHPTYHSIAKKPRIQGTGLQRLLQMMKNSQPDIPENLFLQRFGMTLRQVFNELSDYQRLYLLPSKTPRPDLMPFVNNLIDAVTAQLSSPASDATLREYHQPRGKTVSAAP